MADVAAEGARLSRLEREEAARQDVRRTFTGMVTGACGRTLAPPQTTGRIWPGINAMEPEPTAQIEAAHATEQTAHTLIEDLIRLACEASRYAIGDALDPHGHAAVAKEPVAEVAYHCALDYQTGVGMRTVTWTCHQLIADRSPFCNSPAAKTVRPTTASAGLQSSPSGSSSNGLANRESAGQLPPMPKPRSQQ
jgi:hypothetical protein